MMSSKETNREIIVSLLRNIKERGDMEGLISYLDSAGFFTSPASTKYHGCYPGGLSEHSLNVMEILSTLNGLCGKPIEVESVILASLLHDVCKAGAYLEEQPNFYIYNTEHMMGHSLLSVKLIKKFISLRVEEENAIKFHMGVYGVFGSGTRVEEYNIATLIDAFGYTSAPLVKMLYLADEIATMREKVFDERKAVRG